MITVNELVDLRMQQHIAHEIYRQQIMQRIPDPFPSMLPIPIARHVIMPARETLPGVAVTLQNDDLWKEFHSIGTEMIITKSGRRMFPSMRLSLSGLEDEANYCVLLEMVPVGDCRYKFSGSQWVPAGGAEPQSPQRMYLHPDSPASGSHWQAQPILFNKVKLTNNTLDSNGHIVLASMHKYQPRIHIIRTSDLTHIPWAPQKAFVYQETDFVAVTAYQNDRITKLKIDNNPFAKGFRETGQSRCKRKMSTSLSDEDTDHQQPQTHQLQQDQHQLQHQHRDTTPEQYPGTIVTESLTSVATSTRDLDKCVQINCLKTKESSCSQSSSDEIQLIGGSREFAVENSNADNCVNEISSCSKKVPPHFGMPLVHPDFHSAAAGGEYASTNAACVNQIDSSSIFLHNFQQNMQTLLPPSLVDLACSYFGRPEPIYAQHLYPHFPMQTQNPLPLSMIELPVPADNVFVSTSQMPQESVSTMDSCSQVDSLTADSNEIDTTAPEGSSKEIPLCSPTIATPPKRKCFSISSILGGNS